ncbi:hypothetical protein ES708_32943 [subsurface metagenome]
MKNLVKNFSLIVITLAVAGFAVSYKSNVPKEQEVTVKEQKVDRKVAVQAYSFKEFTFFEAVDKTVEAGAPYIEAYSGQIIGGEFEGKTHFTMDQETRDIIKKKLNDAGVKLVCYGVISGIDEAEGWDKVFEFAADMGIEVITAEPDIAHLDYIGTLCDKYEINIAIHNHPTPSFYWDPEVILAAIKDKSDRIGACADIGHWARSGLDPVECLKKLEGHIISSHYKDMNLMNDLEAYTVIFGEGVLDMPAILAELDRQNFDGVYTIEYEHNWMNSVPDIKKCVEYLNSH